MRHNRLWERWYDTRASENDPPRSSSGSNGNDLESSVNNSSIGGNYRNGGLTRRALIGSSLSLAAAYMLTITACGGQAPPTPSPTSTYQRAVSTPTARQKASTPKPTLEATIKAVPTATSAPPQYSNPLLQSQSSFLSGHDFRVN